MDEFAMFRQVFDVIGTPNQMKEDSRTMEKLSESGRGQAEGGGGWV